jgi:hypothetical protein
MKHCFLSVGSAAAWWVRWKVVVVVVVDAPRVKWKQTYD